MKFVFWAIRKKKRKPQCLCLPHYGYILCRSKAQTLYSQQPFFKFFFPFSHASYHTLSKNIKFLVLPRKRQLIITQYITYQSVVKCETGSKANSCTFAPQSLLKDENLLPFPPLNHQGHQNRGNVSGMLVVINLQAFI